MTLQQLKYIVVVAEKGSINEAAKELFISQPSLSNAILELEKETHTIIFTRTNRGVKPTAEGQELLGYARQVLTQSELFESKYITGKTVRKHFSVSTQHYSFTANAFCELVKLYDNDEYEFELNETETYEVIENVKNMFSDLGIIYLSYYNENVINRLLKENNLQFTEIFCAKPYIFVNNTHPLCHKSSIDIEELAEYPCITFTQHSHNAFYFSEEILSSRNIKRNLRVSDRAAAVDLMSGVDAYMITSGVLPKFLHSTDYVSIPLNVNEKIQVGIITNKDIVLSDISLKFCEILKTMTNIYKKQQ